MGRDTRLTDAAPSTVGQRVLIVLSVLGFAAWAVASANPWHLIVLEDRVRPAALLIGSLSLSLLLIARRRAAARSRVDGSSKRAPMPLLVLAAAVVAVPVTAVLLFLAVGVILMPIDEPLRDETDVYEHPDGELHVEVHWPICSTAEDGPIYLIAERGLASRRVGIAYLQGECPVVDVRFPQEPGVVLLEIGGTPHRIEFDPETLDLHQKPVRTTWG